MNSPPLEVWFTGSLPGGRVSAATSFGPGAAALRSVRGGAGGTACAGAGARAAAVSAAPLRNLRRSARGRSLDVSDIVASLARERRATRCALPGGSPAAEREASYRAGREAMRVQQ